MSSLKTKLSDLMKTSMKSGDKDTLAFVRNLHAAIRKKEIDEKIEIDDAAFLKMVASSIKQRQDSITQFEQGGRPDLVTKEKAELAFLQQFQPPQLSDDELKQIVQEAIQAVQAKEAKDIGKVMQAVLPKVQGRADGGRINQTVRSLLN